MSKQLRFLKVLSLLQIWDHENFSKSLTLHFCLGSDSASLQGHSHGLFV